MPHERRYSGESRPAAIQALLAEKRREALLGLLACDPSGVANDALLGTLLQLMGHAASPEAVADDLQSLAAAGRAALQARPGVIFAAI